MGMLWLAILGILRPTTQEHTGDKRNQEKHINLLIMTSYMVVIIISFLLRKAFEGWKESYLLSSEPFFRIHCETTRLPSTQRNLN